MAKIIGGILERAQAALALSPTAEWCDANQLRANFGINRGYAYDLDREGLIKSKNVRRRGMTRGRRLFSVESVREFLASLDDERANLWVNTAEGLEHRQAARANGAKKNSKAGGGSP